MRDVKTPELDKQLAIIKSGKAAIVQTFYDWLWEEKGWQLGQFEEWKGYRDPVFTPVYVDPEQLLADFFGIDRNRIEQERRQILEALRENPTPRQIGDPS